MKRIVIVGTSGSGKTTLGKFLETKLSLRFVDLDELFWLPNWKERPEEEFHNLIMETVEKDSWIIAGNQTKLRHLIWPRADTIIWLDLPLRILIWRVFKRGAKQAIKKEMLCNGNYQTLFQFLWILCRPIKTYRRRRKNYQELSRKSSHLKWIHLKSSKERAKFNRELKQKKLHDFQ